MTGRESIAAIATAAGRGGIGIVRVSGTSIEAIVHGIVGRVPLPRKAQRAAFLDARRGVIDEGVVLYFPRPHSYTGEDVLELHGHGGPIVLREILNRCVELGARLARPGEFTERAYLNGKLDLAQAESVADLINATTAAAARSALRSLQGAFSGEVEALAHAVMELRMVVEATLDFPEEEIDVLSQSELSGRLSVLRSRVERVFEAARQGSLLRSGIQVVLAGQPNVGKSSLLNILAGEDLAIVTDIPGTTRDLIRQTINLEGVPAHIFDTAGLRESRDPVEMAGMDRAWKAIEKGDVVVLLMDARQGETVEDRNILQRLPQALPVVRVMNKIDLLAGQAARESTDGGRTLWLSARTGAGIELLRHALLEIVGWQADGEGIYMARERHLEALSKVRSHLIQAESVRTNLELLAEELRLSQGALASITGSVTSDDLLGEIFSRFCIGK